GINFTKAPLIYLADGFKSTADSIICPDDVCTNRTYDTTNKILRFSVSHFSTYFTQTNTTNGAPVITSTPVTQAIERARYTYDVEAADPDGDILVYSLITSPSGMSISNNTGLITWTPSTSQLGLNNVAVSVSDGNLTSNQSFQITAGKGPMLLISNLDVKVDGKTSKNIQNNTGISKKAKPGSKVEFKLEIENLFTREEGLKIEDISAEVAIEDIDDGDDLDNDAKEFDLKAGKKEDVKIGFDIPLEVDEDNYDIIIDVEGKDENGTTHRISYNLKIEVKKENHEIRIIKSALTPPTIQCQRQISLDTEIINTGSNDEDDVRLEVASPSLDISSLIKGISLNEGDEDNTFVKLIKYSISQDVLPGTYPITINAYYDDKLSGTKTAELAVQECEQTKQIKQEVKEEKPNVEVIRPAAIKEQKPAAPLKVSFAQTDEYKLLLTILITLFAGTFIFIIGAAFIILKK
ncbi:MAG: putative Ig domain-containing protein, partial [Nanoarchaeota archaeon]|nr:putative Ig domain-containing protein [Nanoarchaeota archaeon]